MRVELNSSGCSCWVQCPHSRDLVDFQIRDQLRHARCEHRREHRVPGRGDHEARHVVDACARLIGGELPVAIEVAVPVHGAAEATGAEGIDVHRQLFGAEHPGAQELIGNVHDGLDEGGGRAGGALLYPARLDAPAQHVVEHDVDVGVEGGLRLVGRLEPHDVEALPHRVAEQLHGADRHPGHVRCVHAHDARRPGRLGGTASARR